MNLFCRIENNIKITQIRKQPCNSRAKNKLLLCLICRGFFIHKFCFILFYLQVLLACNFLILYPYLIWVKVVLVLLSTLERTLCFPILMRNLIKINCVVIKIR